MTSKRQQTMAKMTRERAVREKRARKLEKKHAAALERKAKADGLPFGVVPDPDAR
jgi:ribosomal protein L9